MSVASAIFVYGTLMFPQIMGRVIGREPLSETAIASGWERLRIRGESYPGLIARPGASVAGRLYRDLEPSEICCLDEYEGEAYYRARVRVDTEQGPAEAEAYLIRTDHQHLLSPERWEPTWFAEHHFADYLAALDGETEKDR